MHKISEEDLQTVNQIEGHEVAEIGQQLSKAKFFIQLARSIHVLCNRAKDDNLWMKGGILAVRDSDDSISEVAARARILEIANLPAGLAVAADHSSIYACTLHGSEALTMVTLDYAIAEIICRGVIKEATAMGDERYVVEKDGKLFVVESGTIEA